MVRPPAPPCRPACPGDHVLSGDDCLCGPVEGAHQLPPSVRHLDHRGHPVRWQLRPAVGAQRQANILGKPPRRKRPPAWVLGNDHAGSAKVLPRRPHVVVPSHGLHPVLPDPDAVAVSRFGDPHAPAPLLRAWYSRAPSCSASPPPVEAPSVVTERPGSQVAKVPQRVGPTPPAGQTHEEEAALAPKALSLTLHSLWRSARKHAFPRLPPLAPADESLQLPAQLPLLPVRPAPRHPEAWQTAAEQVPALAEQSRRPASGQAQAPWAPAPRLPQVFEQTSPERHPHRACQLPHGCRQPCSPPCPRCEPQLSELRPPCHPRANLQPRSVGLRVLPFLSIRSFLAR